jgi:4-hydroxymandelate oxidase
MVKARQRIITMTKMNDDHYILPKLSQIPQDVISIGDYARLAKNFMPHPIYEYITGGAGDDLTLENNCQAFANIKLNTRVLRTFSQASTSVTINGQAFTSPLFIAPLAYQRLVHPQGELATAEAAEALNITMLTSTLASVPLEDIATAGGQPGWFQLYFQEDKQHTLSLVQRAEQAGYQAIVVTVDAPVSGLRNRAQRAGFTLPEGVSAVNLPASLAGNGAPLTTHLAPGQSPLLHGLMAQAPNWQDIAWLQQQTNLPIWIKGISHPEDAKLAAQLNVAGIVVSNHGGRTLDGMPASIEVLPVVRKAIGPKLPILFDSGIRRGSDIFKALALGANGVLIGRPVLYGLAVAGALGVAHSLQLLHQELEITMALTGCQQISDITPQAIYRADSN